MTGFEIPEIPVQKLVVWTVGVTLVACGFWLLFRFHHLLPMVLAAFILSIGVRPGVDWLEKKGIPKPAGVLLIFILIGGLVGLLVWFTIPVMVEQSAAMWQSLVDGYRYLYEGLQQSPNILVRRLLLILPDNLTGLFSGTGTQPMTEVEVAMPASEGQGPRVAAAFMQFIAIIALTFYWTLDEGYIMRAFYLLIPMEKRDDIRGLVQRIEVKIGDYLRGQGILCLLIAGLAFAAYSLIGLPHALLLAIIAGLMEAVPIVGPLLGAVPAIIIGFSISPVTALWVILATAVIQQLENSLLVPRVMKSAIGVRPLVTLLALVAFSSLFGILGALVALPLAAVAQMLLDRFLQAREGAEQGGTGRDRMSLLQYHTSQLVQDVRQHVRHKEEVPSAMTDALEDKIEGIALDLQRYLAARGEKTV